MAISSLVGMALAGQEKYVRAGWVLATLFVLVWLLKTVFVPVSVPFFGSDAYYEYAATLEIQQFGWLGLSPWGEGLSLWPHQTNYPFLSALSLSLIGPIRLSLVSWTRWAMPVMSLISLHLVYALSLAIYQSKRVALLGSLGFGLTYMYLMFHSLYVREALAFAFFLAAVYAIVKSRGPSALQYRLIAMVLAIGVVVTHHLMALVLLVFVLMAFLIQLLARQSLLRERFRLLTPESIHFALWLFILVILATYWLYLRYTPVRLAQTLVQDAVAGSEAVVFRLPRMSRYTVLFVMQLISTGVFGLLAVVGLYMGGNDRRTWHLTSVTWGGLMGLGSFIIAAGGIQGTSSLPSRFEILSYAFLLPAAAQGAMKLIQKHIGLSWLFGLVFVVYGLTSLYRFPLYLYSDIQPNLTLGETRSVLLSQEYQLMLKIRRGHDMSASQSLLRLIRPISDVGVRCYDCDISHADDDTLDFTYLIVGERDHYALPPELSLTLLEARGASRIYDAGWAQVYASSLRLEDGFHMDEVLDLAKSSAILGETSSPAAWAALIAQFGLVILGGASLVDWMRGDVGTELGLGVMLILLAIFAIYLLVNILGKTSSGWLVVITLVGLAGFSIWHFRLRLAALITPVRVISLGVLMLSYGPIVDNIPGKQLLEPYTEFYVDSIAVCPPNVCIGLHLANHEGRVMTYHVDLIESEVKVNNAEDWHGVVTLPATLNGPLMFWAWSTDGQSKPHQVILRFAP